MTPSLFCWRWPPRWRTLGLTTVGGNVPQARGLRNALALLNAAGRTELPVAAGAGRPLAGGRFRPAVRFHGPGGLSVRLTDSPARPAAASAVEFLNAQLTARPGADNPHRPGAVDQPGPAAAAASGGVGAGPPNRRDGRRGGLPRQCHALCRIQLSQRPAGRPSSAEFRPSDTPGRPGRLPAGRYRTGGGAGAAGSASNGAAGLADAAKTGSAATRPAPGSSSTTPWP